VTALYKRNFLFQAERLSSISAVGFALSEGKSLSKTLEMMEQTGLFFFFYLDTAQALPALSLSTFLAARNMAVMLHPPC
jgi:hypothetical protein